MWWFQKQLTDLISHAGKLEVVFLEKDDKKGKCKHFFFPPIYISGFCGTFTEPQLHYGSWKYAEI